MKITADEIIALRPCWSDTEVRAAVGRGKTPRQIAEATRVSAADRRWVLTRLAARTPKGRRALALWAAGCAQDVRHLITDEDARDAADVCIATVVAWSEGVATTQDCADAAAYAYAVAATAFAAAYAAYAAAAYAADAAAAAAAYAYAATGQKHIVDLAAIVESL